MEKTLMLVTTVCQSENYTCHRKTWKDLGAHTTTWKCAGRQKATIKFEYLNKITPIPQVGKTFHQGFFQLEKCAAKMAIKFVNTHTSFEAKYHERRGLEHFVAPCSTACSTKVACKEKHSKFLSRA